MCHLQQREAISDAVVCHMLSRGNRWTSPEAMVVCKCVPVTVHLTERKHVYHHSLNPLTALKISRRLQIV